MFMTCYFILLICSCIRFGIIIWRWYYKIFPRKAKASLEFSFFFIVLWSKYILSHLSYEIEISCTVYTAHILYVSKKFIKMFFLSGQTRKGAKILYLNFFIIKDIIICMWEVETFPRALSNALNRSKLSKALRIQTKLFSLK